MKINNISRSLKRFSLTIEQQLIIICIHLLHSVEYKCVE